MNNARKLINEVESAGGVIQVYDGRLSLSAPNPLPDKLVQELKNHKPEVIEFLATSIVADSRTLPPLVPNASASPFGSPTDPAEWPEWVEERAAIIQFDGYRSPQEAYLSAYNEALEAWCSQHWEPPSSDSCAACGAPNPGFECGDGAAVCRRSDYACLIEYGTKRKQEAVKWLRRAGIEAASAIVDMGVSPLVPGDDITS